MRFIMMFLFCLCALGVFAQVQISDVEVTIDSRTNHGVERQEVLTADPGESIKVLVEVSNTGSNDASDAIISLDGGPFNGDDDALRASSSYFSIDGNDDESNTLRFELPLLIAEGSYPIALLLSVDGTEVDGYVFILDVEKSTYELQVSSFEVYPKVSRCAKFATAVLELTNTGTLYIENVKVVLRSGDFQKPFLLKHIPAGSGKESIARIEENIPINDIPGEFGVTATIEYDGISSSKSSSFSIRACDLEENEGNGGPEVVLHLMRSAPPTNSQKSNPFINAIPALVVLGILLIILVVFLVFRASRR